ncbi:MAG: aminotransferase class I/II-fold pyridoxal phosphate-dependent enzyme [Candidatus Eremiobacteraeota bacterium]|nr:aminotransferase class I/II-fold pyridoxal phosphate-dependent enzyme [Candidatus Eremiobacteraeota bacterium]MBC5827229.1 aminotransferase class I/II-fold pyridoxal phosphate-dependent enzyme [Candidatus Eremiobacteraeota bacterium]
MNPSRDGSNSSHGNRGESPGVYDRTSEKWRKYPADVLPLFVAEMDFELAPAVSQALYDAIERSDTGYAWPPALREIFSRYAKNCFDWTVPAERVFVVNDVMGGVTETLRALTQPGDGVAIMPPVYPPFFEIVRTAERHVVEVELLRDGMQYAINWDGLERAFARHAKALLLCHPHNPVGHVFARAELERLAALARSYGVLVISDEIHAPLVYPGAAHVPFVMVAEPQGIDSVTLMSASKGWNIAGLKCAQMIAGSSRVHERFKQLPADVTDRIGHLGVIATAAAYADGSSWLRTTLNRLDENRRLLATLLARQLPQIGYGVPDATYLAWLDCRALDLGDDPAQAFIDRGKVALSHGPDFGAAGRGFTRFNFATTPEIISEAVSRMALSA